jgi:hypothetical protein
MGSSSWTMTTVPAAWLRAIAGTLVLSAIVGAAACSRPQTCDICAMQVSPGTRAVIDDHGRRRVVCDPRCALTYQQQTGARVALREVRDFGDRRPLDPATAWYVTGSDTAPDARTTTMTTWPAAEPASLQWHRCLPSVLAFRTRDEAERFREQHGGQVMTLAELGFGAR